MSNGMVFILHDGTDETYAGDLAGALAPLTAIALALPKPGQRGLTFGLGAACVLAWNGENAQAEAFVEALPPGTDAIVLARAEAKAPDALRARAEIVRSEGAAGADAEKLRALITALHARQASRSAQSARRTASPRLGGTGAQQGDGDRNARVAARTAVGLAATLAVVGAGASFISSRTNTAQASSPETTEIAPEPELDAIENAALDEAAAPAGASEPAAPSALAAAERAEPAPPPPAPRERFEAAAPEALTPLETWLLAPAPLVDDPFETDKGETAAAALLPPDIAAAHTKGRTPPPRTLK